MAQAVVAFAAVGELAAFVHTVLCEKDALDPAQTPLFRTPLKRAGRDCGVVFHVEGPRLLRTSAVWSADADRIIFYDSTGVRFRAVELSEGPGDAAGAGAGAGSRRLEPTPRPTLERTRDERRKSDLCPPRVGIAASPTSAAASAQADDYQRSAIP